MSRLAGLAGGDSGDRDVHEPSENHRLADEMKRAEALLERGRSVEHRRAVEHEVHVVVSVSELAEWSGRHRSVEEELQKICRGEKPGGGIHSAFNKNGERGELAECLVDRYLTDQGMRRIGERHESATSQGLDHVFWDRDGETLVLAETKNHDSSETAINGQKVRLDETEWVRESLSKHLEAQGDQVGPEERERALEALESGRVKKILFAFGDTRVGKGLLERAERGNWKVCHLRMAAPSSKDGQ